MGRRAKYFTREERLKARRAQRALRDSQPGRKEKRSEENRRAWRKKKAVKLLNQDPPKAPDDVYELAEMNMFVEGYERWFQQFLEGRDCLGLDEVDIEVEELESLTAAPPYPTSITRISSFSDDWPLIRTVIQGYAARKYIEQCDVLVKQCRDAPEHIIITQLHVEYQNLIAQWSDLTEALGRLQSAGDQPETEIARQNTRWISRLVLYKIEDIRELRNGMGSLVNMVMDRRWRIERGGRV
ncbi:hypothetical protein NMY22_g16451 [Coprinellus aureogranulatus]|nr:hypothetical protein NMY22_g16451 [Coprinellus aureogranulatus]